MTRSIATVLFVVFVVFGEQASHGAFFFGPSPYLSAADIPAGFYLGGSPTALENGEDGTLNFGITASAGGPAPPSFYTDSVDADDGVIDGLGRNGWSIGAAVNAITYTFAAPVTAAGLVYTDAEPGAIVSFEAFGPGMVSLGSLGPYSNLFLGPSSGETAEDRFFGVQNLGGIIALRVTTNIADESRGFGIEVDHIQYGVAAIPEPSSFIVVGLVGLVTWAMFGSKQLYRCCL
jgi:hypothetical protein